MATIVRTQLIVARQQRRWSQQEVADLLGTTQNNVSRWERGITTPNPYFRATLSHLFGKSIEELGISPRGFCPAPVVRGIGQERPLPVSCPEIAPIWTVPYQRNPFFTGREALLQQIHRMCTQRHQHNQGTRIQPYALVGLGGMGKTHIMVEYAYRYAHDYSAILWIQAETMQAFTTSIGRIAHAVASMEGELHDQDKRIEMVLSWLQTYHGWLLILDHVEEIAIVKALFTLTRVGTLLITSRRQLLQPYAQALLLEKMSIEEGVIFLHRRAHLPISDPSASTTAAYQSARTIVETMDGLPLALDQAGAYMYECRCHFSEYALLLQEHILTFLAMRDASLDHPLSVVQTISLAFEQLQQVNTHAALLLTVCLFLAPDTISKTMLQAGIACLGPEFQRLSTEHLLFHQAIKDLLMYSLIEYHAHSDAMRLHRLTRLVCRSLLSPEQQHEWQQRSAALLDVVFPGEVNVN